MDAHTEQLITELVGQEIGGYMIGDYLDKGASALVFKAIRDKGTFAIKVFDPDFLKGDYKAKHIQRIERQLVLRGKHHPNLIEISAGGKCETTGFYFIVMPYIDAPNLAKVIATLPRAKIRPIIAQVAQAAKYLDSLDLVHRDIKPANIALMPGTDNAVLLDLGVIRPLEVADLTDSSKGPEFVATTQYSPPELNVRDEEDNREGWKAVTFYQLGAVLHDLIMRRPLFADRKNPYQRLVKAILLEDPIIQADDVEPGLIRLARLCLIKDPNKRSALVCWDDFSSPATDDANISDHKAKIARLREAVHVANSAATQQSTKSIQIHIVGRDLSEQLRLACIEDNATFPPCARTDLGRATDDRSVFALSFAPSKQHGLQQYAHMVFTVVCIDDSTRHIEICMAAGISAGTADVAQSNPPFLTIYKGALETAKDPVLTRIYAAFAAAIEEVMLPAIQATALNAVTWLS